MKKALITGVTGQDGAYLSELLLEKGYETWGPMALAGTKLIIRDIGRLTCYEMASGDQPR